MRHAHERELITSVEERALLVIAKLGEAKAGDLQAATPKLSKRQRTNQISKLLERGVIRALSNEGSIPEALHRPR